MQDRYENRGCMVDNSHLGGGIHAALKFNGIIVVYICQGETLRWLETCLPGFRTTTRPVARCPTSHIHPRCPSDQSSFISHPIVSVPGYLFDNITQAIV
jgi:hypothetical protein